MDYLVKPRASEVLKVVQVRSDFFLSILSIDSVNDYKYRLMERPNLNGVDWFSITELSVSSFRLVLYSVSF